MYEKSCLPAYRQGYGKIYCHSQQPYSRQRASRPIMLRHPVAVIPQILKDLPRRGLVRLTAAVMKDVSENPFPHLKLFPDAG